MNISEQTANAFEQQPNKVFIGGLSVNCEEQELTEFLERFGPLTKVEVIKDSKTRAHKGYAFATFLHRRDMQRAIGKNHVLRSKQFEIREFVDSNTNSEYLDRIAKRKIFISNIKEPITEKDLSEFFAAFGPIEELTISRDATTGLSKGFGFVLFSEEESKRMVLRDYGDSGVRIKCYELQVKDAIPKKDINKIKQANVLSPHPEPQTPEVSQDFLPRRFDFSDRNAYLSVPGMIGMIPDPNPSPVSFIKEGLTPTTYLHSTGSPFTPNPGNRFSFTPDVSPMAMVHPQFNFGQLPQHALRMPDYHMMPTQQFSKPFPDARLAPSNPSHQSWNHDLGEQNSHFQGEFGNPQSEMFTTLQACSAKQRISQQSRNPSASPDCDPGTSQRPKPRKTPHLALRLGQSDNSEASEPVLLSLPLSKALCLCSTEADAQSDSTSLFTTLRRFRCSCGGPETRGAPTDSQSSPPTQVSHGRQSSGQLAATQAESARLEKPRPESEVVEYNHWQHMKVSKDKLEKLRRRIASQEEPQVTGLNWSPPDRDAADRKVFGQLD